jgi:hypothetical protein
MLNNEAMGFSPGLDGYYYFFQQNLILTGKYSANQFTVNSQQFTVGFRNWSMPRRYRRTLLTEQGAVKYETRIELINEEIGF